MWVTLSNQRTLLEHPSAEHTVDLACAFFAGVKRRRQGIEYWTSVLSTGSGLALGTFHDFGIIPYGDEHATPALSQLDWRPNTVYLITK